jgi:hypothetical protein
MAARTRPLQYRRARRIAWTGAAIVAAACAAIGVTDDDGIVHAGAWYPRVVGPVYGLYGLGMALYFAAQRFGNVAWTVAANGLRLVASAGCALAAAFWLDLGATGFFGAVAAGFCAYAALAAAAVARVRDPASLAAA